MLRAVSVERKCASCGSAPAVTRGRCRPCINERARARWRKRTWRGVEANTAQEVFGRWHAKIPRPVRHLVERETERVCRHCLAWKENERFVRCERGRLTFVCRECDNLRANEVRRRDPVRLATERRIDRERRRDMRRVAELAMGVAAHPGEHLSQEQKDKLRRTLLASPPRLLTEETMLAYYRGFLAGATRTEDESRRFESLKDLIHRIAAEQARKIHGLLYEDALSYAYTSALAYLRKKITPEDEEHFRKKAAMAIRNGIIDGVRETPSVLVLGPKLALRKGAVVGWGQQFGVDEDGASFESSVRAREEAEVALDPALLARVHGLKPREKLILEMIAKGHTFKEAGEACGITESRVVQIVKALRERCGERLLEALSA